MEDDDDRDAGSGDASQDEDFSAGDMEEEEDSEDSSRKKRGSKRRGASKPKPAARTTRSRGRPAVSYKDQDSSEEDESEDEDGDEDWEDSDAPPSRRGIRAGAGGRKGRTRAPPPRKKQRVRRWGASSDEEEEVEEDNDDDENEVEEEDDDEDDDDEEEEGDEEDGDDDDEELARRLDREINGLRARTPRRAVAAGGAPPQASSPNGAAKPRISSLRSCVGRVPPSSTRGGSGKRGRTGGGGGGGGGSGGGRAQQRQSKRSAARGISYAEDDDDSKDSEGGGGRGRGGGGGKRGGSGGTREPIAAFEGPGEDEVERVLAHRETVGVAPDPRDPWASKELLIKWMRHSYTHCSWDTRATLEQLGGYKRVLNYMKKVDTEAAEVARGHFTREELELRDLERALEEQLVQQYSQVERVLADGEDEEGSAQYLVKWEGLPYSECTWEREEEVLAAVGGPEQLDLWNKRMERFNTAPHLSVERQRKQFKLNSTRALEKQPEYLTGGKFQLRDYQLDSLNWMVYSWSQDRNVILADEMGLGKTVQCVSFLGYLSESQHIRGPFLVVVPLSTVPNWVREFRRWTPQVNTVVYVGDSRSREVIRSFEFEPPNGVSAKEAGRQQFEVLITTYELILKDANVLSKVRWNYLVVDEAHRLKNAESALYLELSNWHFGNKLLVTGTPLQNSLKELWALLHFLAPDKFPECDAFESEYQLQTMDGVSGLHAVLRPHLLRRVIKDVEKSLPPKNERILRVEMTPLQKQYYKWILARNFRDLNKGTKSGGQVSLLNIIGELKKICNHPFLFESAEESFRGSDADGNAAERLVVASGKMVLLDKLLQRLKQTGHRVLIFSQMVRVLDIISDYCRLRGWQHQRLDGSTPAAARHTAMEHFNKPDSPDFAFLLSTRAGGLGINLATADTVIIFDSDWNPQNDLQAMSRAHRIGQTETVNIYRFVTSGSVEEDILERAKRKMVLDHLVIQRMDTSGRTVLDPQAKNAGKTMFGKDELAAILRFGAEDLFKSSATAAGAEGEGGGGSVGSGAAVAKETHEAAKAMYEEDIDAILARAEVVDNNRPQEAEEGVGGELLSSFNVATFKNEEDDAAFWSRLIPVSERPADEDTQEELLGPRLARLKAEDALMDTDEKARRAAQRDKPGGVRRGPPGSEPGPPVEGAALRIDEWRLDVDTEGIPLAEPERSEGEPHIITRSLCRKDANAFVRAAKRYGLDSRIDEVCADVGKGMEDLTRPQRLSLWLVLMDACRRCISITEGDNQDAKDAILDFFGAAVRAQELMQQCMHMRYLARRVTTLVHQLQPTQQPAQPASGGPPAADSAANGAGGAAAAAAAGRQQKQLISSDLVITLGLVNKWRQEVGGVISMSIPKWGKEVRWTGSDDATLLLGVLKYGLGHWDRIAADPALHLSEKLASVVAPQQQQQQQQQQQAQGGAAAAAPPGGAGEGAGADGGGEGGAEEKEGTDKCKVTLPKASHMETRALGLMKKLYLANKQAQAGGRSGGGRPRGLPGGGLPKPPRLKVPKAPGGGGECSSGALGGGRGRKASSALAGLGSAEGGADCKPSTPPVLGADANGRDGGAPGPPSAIEPRGEGGRGGGKVGTAAERGKGPTVAKRKGNASEGKGGEGKGREVARSKKPRRDKMVTSPAKPTAKPRREQNEAGRGGRPPQQQQQQLQGWGGGGGGDVHELLAGVLPEIKQWRRLGEDNSLDNKEVARRVMSCLQAIGTHIEQVVGKSPQGASGPELRAKLWRQISKATHNQRDGEQLQALYQKILARQQQQGGGGGGGAGTSAATGGSGPAGVA